MKEYEILKRKLINIRWELLKSSCTPKSLKLALILLSVNEKMYKFILSKYKRYENND